MSQQITLDSLIPSFRNDIAIGGKTYVGIDFGTSTTVATIASYDANSKIIKTTTIPLLQKLPDGTNYISEKIPTVIAWLQDKILIGEGANELKYVLEYGKNIWYAFKMELGEDLGAKYFNSVLHDKEPFNIRNPKDATRVFFMYLKLLIIRYCEDNHLSSNIEYAITIPASFEANQRRELFEALDNNGMIVSKQSLIDEPNAAFLSYVHCSMTSERPLVLSNTYNPKVLVFDFGAGTCDISILEIGSNELGVFSKNLAISKYTQLGGNDIDRYITYHYLLPRFLEANDYKVTDFRTPERKNIAKRLYKIAETLKINLNKRLSLLCTDCIIPQGDVKHKKEVVTFPISIDTRKGALYQEEFYLTTEELEDTMQIFLKKSLFPTSIKHEEDYNNIFMPIDSALSKANIDIDELDYILLIGGSAQSPFIQQALKCRFEESELLIPQDLQTHVSAGAAIHSLILNGFGKCIIKPITSEPIVVITKDSMPKVILKAGTAIPCDTITIDDLVPSREGQKEIELPICIGNAKKVVYNLIISNEQGFPLNRDSRLIPRI